MKKATYHREIPAKPLRLTVIKTHEDGTVDLGHGDEKEFTLVVSRCPVSDSAKVGHAVLDCEASEKDAETADTSEEAPAEDKKKKGKR